VEREERSAVAEDEGVQAERGGGHGEAGAGIQAVDDASVDGRHQEEAVERGGDEERAGDRDGRGDASVGQRAVPDVRARTVRFRLALT